jgi:POT family proton-dependent oligopeptide transporter
MTRISAALRSPLAPLLAAIAAERLAWYLTLGCLVSWLGSTGSASYGNLVAAAYLTPLLGGWVGSRIGLARTATIGAAVLATGYALLSAGAAQPIFLLGSPDPASIRLAGFVLLAAGCGLFKPNLSALVGDVSLPDQRERSYARFYAAINLGSLPSTILGAWLHHAAGWPAAFAVCAVAAALSTAVLFSTHSRSRSRIHSSPSNSNSNSSLEQAISKALSSVPALISDRPLRLLPLLVLLVGGSAFFSVYYQMGTTLMVWAAPTMRDPEVLQTFNSLFVLLLALTPLAGWRTSLRLRCFAAMVATTAAALLLFATAHHASLAAAAAWFFLITLAEILISPLGMDLAARCVPRRWAPVATAAWFCSIAAGGKVAGLLGSVGVVGAAELSLVAAVAGAIWFMLLGDRLEESALSDEFGDLSLTVTRPIRLTPGITVEAGTLLRAFRVADLPATLHRRGGVDYIIPQSAVAT